MKFRELGRTGWASSVLGLRVMELPEDSSGNINEEESIETIRYAVDKGINYLDSGYPCEMEKHEVLSRITGKALKDGYGKKVRTVATLPSLRLRSGDDFNRYLNNQIEWLDIDYIDFYLIGFLNRDVWSKLKDMNILDQAENALSDKRIKNIGFYMHDDFQTLRDIINSYDNWALSQFSYSFMDINHHPGIVGIKSAYENGLGVVVSDPLRNGRLNRNVPGPVSNIWKSAEKQRSIIEWGLNWAWNMREVSTVLCDMKNIQEVEEDTEFAQMAEADSISIGEEILISRVRETYQELRPIQCTACRCCMPCPAGVDVPRIFEIYNDALIYGDVTMGKYLYRHELHDIGTCTDCGHCVSRCPKKIPIDDCLERASKLIGH